ncbi:MAG TPA: putative metal-binding motif-containing protein [Polyangiaceae bacterium]|nr:putative metal-binding motif-containing protein [Polyangiaceae bacterium]
MSFSSVESRAALPSTCSNLGEALIGHSCFHAELGPFTEVTASGTGLTLEQLPNVDAVHTFYDVVLSDPLGQSALSYRVASPARAGSWAVFHDPEIPLRIVDSQGQTQPVQLEAPIAGCRELALASVYELKDERYRLLLGPSVKTHARLVIENVDDFLVFSGIDRDGDGYGDPRETVTTACKPEAGYAPNDLDCDDSNPDIHPGARELCDGLDQNCNGFADDAGLPCESGVGECKNRGQLACQGEAALCEAPEIAAQPETCDGRDEDCDGVDDLSEAALCGNLTQAPRCIRVLGQVRCGCSTDVDCGDATSARVCNLDTRTCVDGCFALSGRNGCKPPVVCTSADPRFIGQCELIEGASVGAPSCGDGSEPCAAPRTEDGCGCSVPGKSGVPSIPTLALAVGVIWAWTWRRRSTARSRNSTARRLTRFSSLLLLSALAPSCGGRVEERLPSAVRAREPEHDHSHDPGPQCSPRLGAKPIEHACQHAGLGPFVEIVPLRSPTQAPDMSLVHHTYEFRMLGESPPYRGYARFRTSRGGAQAFMRPAGVHIALAGSNSKLSSVEAVAPDCSLFSESSVMGVVAEQEYSVEISSEQAREFNIFVEHLEAFADEAWAERCD